MQVPFHSVLCPTDLSDIGNLAVPLAYRLVKDGGTVHLLHVGEPPFLGNPLYGQFVEGWVPTREERQAGEDRVSRALHDLPPERGQNRGVRTEYHLEHGIGVADLIEAKARHLDVAAVVMGTRGRTGLDRLVMGSVATEVLKKKDLRVVLVHQDL